MSSAVDQLKSVATTAVVWVVVGVPVAAVVASFRVFVWVLTAIPEMAATAAVLGSVQGLMLVVAGGPGKSESVDLRWIGGVSGGVLGLLGFPPVFSRVNIIADRPMVAIFLLAALIAGIAAGLVSASVVATKPRGHGASLARGVAAGCLLLPLAALDYHFYWAATADRIPLRQVSHQVLTSLTAGDARGSARAGCYQYLGRYSQSSGITGAEGALLTVSQADGALKVWGDSAHPMLGGVDGNGRFRFGAESFTGQDTLRVLWEGKFDGDSLDFTRRTTVLRGDRVLNTTKLTGTAQRISCNR